MNQLLSKLEMPFVAVIFVICIAFSALPTLAQNKADFVGSWEGKISELPFQMRIWEVQKQWNATILIQGNVENLQILGWKEMTADGGKPITILYLFRPADLACISVFSEKGEVNLAYFEHYTVRRVVLKKKDRFPRNSQKGPNSP